MSLVTADDIKQLLEPDYRIREKMKPKTYFVTGGAGSFGKRFVKHIIENTEDVVIVYSRDERKHWEMRNEIKSDRIKYIIGDVRDINALRRNMPEGCMVLHAAALKHVHTGETQAIETIKTNVEGTQNVVNVVNEKSCKMLLVSTDKAVEPINTYGASKMLAESVTLQGGQVVCRWGNVVGSSGSILHIFNEQAASGHIFTITHHEMTRFLITFDRAIDFAMKCFEYDSGVYFPKLKACRIVDIAYAFDNEAEFREIGIQPGEKLSELLSRDPRIDSAYAEMYTVDEIRRLIDEAV